MKTLLLSVAIVSLLGALAAVPHATQAPPSHPRPTRAQVPPPKPAITQRMYAPLPTGAWSDAEVLLNNNSPLTMTVATTLYSDGVGVPGATITIEPGHVLWTKLSDLNTKTGRPLHMNDGIELCLVAKSMELGAQLLLTRDHGRGTVDVPFSGDSEFRSSHLEAVWPMPVAGRSIVAVGNTSDASVFVNITQPGRPGLHFELAAHTAKTLVSAAVDSRVESMAFDVQGPVGSVRINGFVERAGRFFAGIRFYDTAAVRQPDLFATNLRVGSATPWLALRNTSDIPIDTLPQFFDVDSDSAPISLPALQVAPHSSVLVDLHRLLDESAQRSLDRVSVHITNSGMPGSLIGALTSADRRHSYDVPLRDNGPTSHATGSYPWRIDGDENTIVSISNVSTKRAIYHARLVYTGGVYYLPQGDIGVGGTDMFDIRRLRDSRIPDRFGTVVPLSVSEGQFRWSSIDSQGETLLAGRAEMVSDSRDRSSSYSCWTCCQDSPDYGYLSPDILGVELNLNNDTGTWNHYVDCYNNDAGSWAASANSWWTQYSSVATIWTQALGDARAHAYSSGASNVQGFWHAYASYNDPNDPEFCLSYDIQPSPTGQVQVKTPTYVKKLTGGYVDAPPPPYDYRQPYQFFDQNCNPLSASHTFSESFTSVTGNGTDPLCFSNNPAGPGGPLDASGSYDDHYTLSTSPSVPPNPCYSKATQTQKIDGLTIVSNRLIEWRYSGVTVGAAATCP